MDKSAFFNIVIRRGSGKFLMGLIHGKAHWTDDLDMALRTWSIEGAAQIAQALPVAVNAVGYQETRGRLQ